MNETNIFYNSTPHNDSREIQNFINDDHLCKQILYVEIGYLRGSVWDLLLLIPVLTFLLGLSVKLNNARLKLRAVHSPIYATFYCLIWMNTIVALIRCIVSMSVNAATTSGDEANIVLYVIMRFFLLATEMSVVVFAMFFGHLDNNTSIRRVLLVTSSIALPYSIAQGSLELLAPDPDFFVVQRNYYLFGHGGSLFWMVSSLLFTLAYSLILLLRLNALRRRLPFLLWMPMKRSFYVYLGFIASLNLAQTIGSAAYHFHLNFGLCLVDLTTWMYFSLLAPFIYYTFIYQFFRERVVDQVENIVFSYKSDEEEGNSIGADYFNSLQLPYSSLNDENVSAKMKSGGGGAFPPSVNPLYAASLQSPESTSGYSINSCDSVTVPL